MTITTSVIPHMLINTYLHIRYGLGIHGIGVPCFYHNWRSVCLFNLSDTKQHNWPISAKVHLGFVK